MKSKYLIILLLMTFLGFSCGTTESVVKLTNVKRLTSDNPLRSSGLDYALPRTVLDVEVVAEKTITKPGPFAAYAERYLGVVDVPLRETTEYRIKEVRLKSHAERDPSQVFRIEADGISNALLVNLNQQGVITGINMPFSFPVESVDNPLIHRDNHQMDIPEYDDLTIRKNTEPIFDTIYRVVRTDTSFIRLPFLKSQVSQKNLNNQAEEAANLIMKLRKRRFYMLTGEYAYRPDVRTPMPDGEAMKVIIRELAQLEYDYVSLFVGRTITETETFRFSYTPTGEGITEVNDLFVFSKFRGILPAGNSNGDPVKIELRRMTDPSALYASENNVVTETRGDEKIISKGLAYRTPALTQVAVKLNNEGLLDKSLLIAQYGVVQRLPSHLLSEPDIMIRFHAELGSLDGIYKK
jgi:hypothetical protein